MGGSNQTTFQEGVWTFTGTTLCIPAKEMSEIQPLNFILMMYLYQDLCGVPDYTM